MEDSYMKTGTTTVGLICKDSVVLAADKRSTAGNLIASKDVDKVIEITPTMALTTAGVVSDIQLLVKYLRAELKLKDVRTGRKTTVKEAANFLANMNYGNLRSNYGICHFLFAGVDETNGGQLYDVYPDGSLTPVKNFIASGSGSVFALGLLEDAWKKDMTPEQGAELAMRAVNVALQRDSASGEGVDVFIIDKKGIRKMQKLLNTRLQ
ncbi:MAG: proteasome subunit beta [Candidatus Nanoarchaeia archaeon]